MRELVSNASDAIDKLKFESLSNDKLIEGKDELCVEVDVDKEAGTITIKDSGIGMSQDEVMANIGTIANSGTKKFLEGLDDKQSEDSNLIGQFGVGFYSAFIVADKVTLTTRKAGDEVKNGSVWESEGKGEYSLEASEVADFGTSVVLYIKEEEKEFLDDYRLRNIISKYSDHITVPIMMVKATEEEANEIEYEMVNKANAFWTQDKKGLSESDYNEFYKSMTYDQHEPLTYMHNKVEGSVNYTSLMYIPSKAPFDMWEQKRSGGVKLYSNRVFIMDNSEDLMPLYLRFVRGVLDTKDLSLNVSREILQGSKAVDIMKKSAVKKILSSLTKMAKNKPEDFAVFWKEYGAVMKEGVVEDNANKDKIAKLLRFSTLNSNMERQTISLDEYIENMKDGQDSIYYVTAESHMAAKNSPHLEIFKSKKMDVLVLSDRVDEWLMNGFGEYEGKSFKSISKGDLGDLNSDEDKAQIEEAVKDYSNVIEVAEKFLVDKVKNVKISNRLSESPSCLVADESEMGTNMERIMQSMGQEIPDSKPTLELNPNHPLVEKLKKKMDENIVLVLFDQAVLAEGGKIDEPAEFVKRMNKLIEA